MTFGKHRGFGKASALALLLILTACGSQIPTAEIEPSTSGASFCLVAKPIIFSRLHDTQETIEQVKEHNAVFDALCKKDTKDARPQ